ncbi:protein DGCR6L isoform X3 [Choloepus didactylus]|uniref:protein DGCR6L isoform X3 n=1 Tax=Choloepus didactylus TaxID=27675 RepID=UPI00189F4F9E|nr:protein DGCR6L isoform X3 [Choloepus didactylus]
MERYVGVLEEAADGTRQQERHYQLLSALQSLVKELPSSFQQRLSYTTLSDLALALLDGTVFEIVQGLLEIQHLTEKSLYNQRLRLLKEHRGTWSSVLGQPSWADPGGGCRQLSGAPWGQILRWLRIEFPRARGVSHLSHTLSQSLCSGRRCGRSTRRPSRPAGPTTCPCSRRPSSGSWRW